MNTEKNQPDTEQDTNSVMDDNAYFAALNKAVNDGDDKEIDRLMKLSVEQGEQQEQSEETPPDDAEAVADENAEKKEEQGEEDQSVVEDSTPDADNPLAKEIEALKRQLHALSSNSGRVNHLQSELSRLKREVDKYKKQAAETAASKPSKAEEKINEVRAADEDLADALAAMREEYAATKAAPQFEADDDGVDLEEELAVVKRIHPDVDRILPGGDMRYYWDKWKEMLQPEHRALAESSYANEYSMAVSAFKADFPRVVEILNQSTQKETQSTTQQSHEPAQPNPVEEARKRKLASTATTRSPANKQGNRPVDEDALYSQIYQDILKENNIR